jgi:DNA-binding transcriptional ArsR family regulator
MDQASRPQEGRFDARSGAQTAPLSDCLQPELFRALGDPTRLTLVCRLAYAGRPLTVTEVSECCGVHLSGVSRHLGQLRDAGVVQSQREGREVRYSLDCGALAGLLRTIAGALEGCRSDEPCCAETPSEETTT